ncbi:DUF4245 domain-containing protein [Streptomyces beijiangensis]|uniref:DUF4245 domain-containing protein n=1 Tax=Streptomyces beijiangensis TaxID=163361 RepID=A0A939FFZ2_9ACTN|nr:DUF4245 domain-containing protein [Streptomyces beijiangensis]MBO0516702.1 DUF4245 domain-containing protein [Streptomyces beijiangensis]
MAGARKQTIRGVVQSLAVIGVVVAGIYVYVPHDDKADPIKKPVDYRVELLTARRAAPYPVAAPQGLPKEWRATSVTYDGKNGKAWHLGFVDPDNQYVAIEQSAVTAGAADKYVTSVSQQAKKTARTQQVNGEAWQRWEGSHYDALVRQDKATGSTTVVTGTASYEQLAKMAAALRTK